ncbi:MAG: SelB C-terminal domain-containing protein, partial [candidate division NC10 bacterium]|nr:SelB C-terminal domain-containing protein [candidate division NC10 bacterium]
ARALSLSELVPALGMDPETLRGHLETLIREGKVMSMKEREEGYLHLETHRRIQEQVLDRLSLFHQQEPLKEGMMQEDLRSKLFPSPEISLFQKVLGHLKEEGKIALEKGRVRSVSHRPQLRAEEEKIKSALERIYREASFQPLLLSEVLSEVCKDQKRGSDLIRLLLEEGTLIRVKGDLLFHRESYERAKQMLLDRLKKIPRISVPEFKDMLGISRKWAIPLLEHFDEIKLTRRVGDERALYG